MAKMQDLYTHILNIVVMRTAFYIRSHDWILLIRLLCKDRCYRCLFYVTDVCFMLEMFVVCYRCLFYVNR